jgi:hypothetical protein
MSASAAGSRPASAAICRMAPNISRPASTGRLAGIQPSALWATPRMARGVKAAT